MHDRIISIGALARHPLWPMDTTRPPRLGHATTTLILDGDLALLVDPGLPGQVLGQRLLERAGMEPADISHVFLTSFQADTCRALPLFENAEWIISEQERETVGTPLAMTLRRELDAEGPGSEIVRELELQVAMLARSSAAPDKLSRSVSLFPLPGMTPGTCGLLLAYPSRTTLITGDAVATTEHLDQGKVLEGAHDIEQARESFAEAVEVADVIIPGRDNMLINPTKRPF
ncbi:MAG TPA: MBL fold metallo-hydrolase [Phycisphaerales bacterium]|nr:MBL fold metallo-hydrolase [Phycisphaerales bacterium]